MIVQALQAARHAPLARTPQPAQGVCYAHKIEKSDAQIDWHLPAATLARKVRAFQPSPGACSAVNGDMVKLWRCEVVAGAGEPGRILAGGIIALVRTPVKGAGEKPRIGFKRHPRRIARVQTREFHASLQQGRRARMKHPRDRRVHPLH